MIQPDINIPYAMKYALVGAEDKPFTVNELAQILLEEVDGFNDEKKTRSYVYAHLRRLQLAGILTRKRQEKVMQYEYCKTDFYQFNDVEPASVHSAPASNELSQVFEQQKARYETELNQAIGEKEVLEDLRPALNSLKADFAGLFRDINNKVQRLTGKINAVDKLYSQISG
ncbi:hypothetical protein I6H07_19605 [Hafnia alvei]|uniref:hypothetical protein n=1 Tax=Hafnia alvei TaxID=569 RepID=UPI000B6D0A56|nr:hypothetical protein [Hafnia alvei]MBI0277985.1 hypothetical protein [Hafnia alvei]PNK96902.1 hypothetical protein CEQ28_004425 [Hafnia alvei]